MHGSDSFFLLYRISISCSFELPYFPDLSRNIASDAQLNLLLQVVKMGCSVYLNCHGSLLLSGAEGQETCFSPSKPRTRPTAICLHPYEYSTDLLLALSRDYIASDSANQAPSEALPRNCRRRVGFPNYRSHINMLGAILQLQRAHKPQFCWLKTAFQVCTRYFWSKAC